MEAPELGTGPGRAGAEAAEEHKPFHARAGGGLAAAEQDRPHVRGRGRRGHAGGVLCRRTPLSALLPGRGRLCPLGDVLEGRPRLCAREETGSRTVTCPRSPRKLVTARSGTVVIVLIHPHCRVKFLGV